MGQAAEVFWRLGYEATSTEDLLDCMGLNKGSLYYTFGSKKELFIKTMDLFAGHALQALRKKIASAAEPIEGIREFFLELADSDDELHQKGCFMGNTVVETGHTDKELKEKAALHLVAMEEVFLQHIRQAKRAGTLKTKERAETLARYLLNLWNGINITRRIYSEKGMLAPIIRMQLAVLK